MTPEILAELLGPLFEADGALHGRYAPSKEPFTPVPGGAAGWQATVLPTGSQAARILRVYPLDRDGGDVVRAHWRNETRALLRVSSTEHPSLPRFREGAYLEHVRLGYVIIDDVGTPIGDGHPVSGVLRRSPLAAFRRWFALVEAAMLVQDEGLIHRSISPVAACALEDEDAPIVLDGFQMSAFVSTWLSGASTADPAWRGALAGPTLASLSPERAGPLLGRPRRLPEGLRSDVFGLGMLGIQWLATMGPEWARGFSAEGYTEDAHRALVLEARAQLADSPVPRPLRQLLTAMTEFDPANRIPGARAADEEGAKLFGSILRALWEREDPTPAPRHIFYLRWTIDRLYSDNRANSSPEHPDYEEYNEYIARDLDGGTVVWSPDGFRPWDTSAKDDKTKQAKIVLLGREYAYFSWLLQQGDTESDGALVIKYPIPVHKVRELRTAARTAPMPTIRPEFFAPSARARPVLTGPPWRAVLDAVRMDASQISRPAVVRASRWLLGAQQALLAAREYRFERDPGAGGAIILRQQHDEATPDEDSEEGAFLSLVREHLPALPMGVLFERVHRDAQEGDESASFEFFAKPGETPASIRLVFEKKLDDYTVRFRSDAVASVAVPRSGYVRPVDPARFVLQRQRRALAELEGRQRHLAAQLAAPVGVRLRDEGPVPDAADVTGVLVHQMRETWPFFALQGPPGTGKTFVAARVVREVLKEDPFARLLVSAQSHHAVDNLLAEIAKSQTKDTILLRIASERTRKKVAPDCLDYLGQPWLERLREKAKQAGSTGSTDLGRLSRRWRKEVANYRVDADLAQRLTRAASVVFASCAGAGSRELEDQGVSFDWVVAEEAARGWITEFLVPLVRGTRWLMIGDQAQLPAFGRKEIDTLLQKDAELRRTEPTTGSAVDLGWKDSYLRHFKHVFVRGAAARVPTSRKLTEQRRMAPDIGELIAQAFYAGELTHHASATRPHGMQIGGVEPSAAFVWIDTTSLGPAAWERDLVNDVEVRLAGYLLNNGVRSVTHDPAIPPLFVLSPYRAQVSAISSYVKQVQREAVRTVDSVQGRQAEVVVVSLARNNAASDERAAIGFLAEPERVNVMFSRARRLLVVIGALAHFERFAVPHWRTILKYTRGDDRFLVDVKATGFRLGAGHGPH